MKLIGAGAAALLVSACSWFDDSTACTRCAAKHGDHKVAAMKSKSYKTAMHLPSGAKQGQCWGRVRIAPRFETKTERVLVKPASTRIVPTSPKYAWTTKRIVVREASERVRVTQPTYRWATERVMLSPPQYKIVTSAPKFRTVKERILVTPARTKWIPKTTCRGPGCKPLAYKSKKSWKHSSYGRYQVVTVMCLVRVPPQYRVVTKRVLVSDGASRRVVVRPAKYGSVRKRVIAQPARVIRTKIPAVYRTVRVRQEVTAAGERRIAVPAVYNTITKRIQISEEKYIWKQVVCKPGYSGDKVQDWKYKSPGKMEKKYKRYKRPHGAKMKKAESGTVLKMQKALLRRGYKVGPLDGIYGPKTRAALVRYQRDHGMAEGQMTLETIKRLGVASLSQASG